MCMHTRTRILICIHTHTCMCCVHWFVLRRPDPGTTELNPESRAPRDHIKMRILQSMVSGIPLILGLGTRVSDPCVSVVFWGPMNREPYGEWAGLGGPRPIHLLLPGASSAALLGSAVFAGLLKTGI